MVEATISFSKEAFSSLTERGYVRGKSRGHIVYRQKALKDWDHLLGRSWYILILNKWTEFSYMWRQCSISCEYKPEGRMNIEGGPCPSI